MTRFFGGLSALMQPPMRPATSYYTYGQLPEEIWPVRNTPPLTQVQQEQEALLFGGPEGDAEGYALGGIAEEGALSALDAPHPQGQVAGPGTGRSDEIDARLSDGEYVIDAETVALLGDGSTEAGARLLDQMRERIRKHKGKALAQGRFSPAAKSPLEYLNEED